MREIGRHGPNNVVKDHDRSAIEVSIARSPAIALGRHAREAGQDYKNYILSLMLFKRLCDQWERHCIGCS